MARTISSGWLAIGLIALWLPAQARGQQDALPPEQENARAAQEPPIVVALPEPVLRANEKIAAALQAPTTMEFVETPLSDVIAFLREQHGIEIQIDQHALDDVGIATDTPLTRKLKGLTLRSALRLMLRDLDLIYVIQDEVLLITTREAAETRMIVKVYEVSDLLPARPPEEMPRAASPSKGAAEPQLCGATLLKVSVPGFDGLVQTILATVDPVTWDRVGGPGSIAPFEGENLRVLVISQTGEAHENVAQLLKALRQVRQGVDGAK